MKYKDPLWIRSWLQTALKKEKEKYEKCPVVPDLMPGHEHAQAWSYVVSAYQLLEQSFKALLYITNDGEIPPQTHALGPLLSKLDKLDNDYASILSEYYEDFRINNNNRKMSAFPIENLREFLINLDGDKNKKGEFIGSFDWRYFLIEETPQNKLPLVSIDYMHEVVYGCLRIIEHAMNGRFDPLQYTLSRRLRKERWHDKYFDWLTVRMNSSDWASRADTIEILWGPDSEERFDLLFPKRLRFAFDKIPQNVDLQVVDRRKEIDEFDRDEGFKKIGIIRSN